MMTTTTASNYHHHQQQQQDNYLVNLDTISLHFSPSFYNSFFLVQQNSMSSLLLPSTTLATTLPVHKQQQQQVSTPSDTLSPEGNDSSMFAMDDEEALKRVIFEPHEMSIMMQHEQFHQVPTTTQMTLSPPSSPSKKKQQQQAKRFSPVRLDDYGLSLITQLKEEIWLFITTTLPIPQTESECKVNAEDLWAWIVQKVPQIKESKYRPCILKNHVESVFARYKEATEQQLELVYNVKRGRKRKGSFSGPSSSDMLPPPTSKRRLSMP